ncbi:MAG TPA: DUF6526 family protein [Bryobacteraceae bacterium]|jgi:hypothetical protein
MAEQTAQNLENHARFDPPFHFVLLPLFGLHFLFRLYELVMYFIRDTVTTSGLMGRVGWVVLAFGFVLLTIKSRTNALKAQDRIIRLEEHLRLAQILPDAMRSRIPELTESQLIGLRFASDGEVTDLVRNTLDKNLSAADIKKSIRTWRADTFRV